MKKILTFTIVLSSLLYSCSKESVDDTPDPSDRWGEWSAWTPEFTNQTADFTQSRSRTVIVNGDRDSNTPSGDANETRNISVTSSVETEEENERTASFNLDLNGDGDFVDYVERTITTYTASNGLGSHSVTSEWSISEDQDASFFTLQYGRWYSQLTLDDTPVFDYFLDMYDAFEDVEEHIKGVDDTCFVTSSLSEDLTSWAALAEYTEVDSDDPTFLRVYIQGIPGEEFGVENQLVDYILLWSAEDVAGVDTIDYGAALRDYFDENTILAVVGEMGRQDDTEITVCSGKFSSEKKSLKDFLSNDPSVIEKINKNPLFNISKNK